MTKTITVAYGDGIGPEIMESTLEILKEATWLAKFKTTTKRDDMADTFCMCLNALGIQA